MFFPYPKKTFKCCFVTFNQAYKQHATTYLGQWFSKWGPLGGTKAESDNWREDEKKIDLVLFSSFQWHQRHLVCQQIRHDDIIIYVDLGFCACYQARV